jgi:hypothetical protein
MKSSPLRTIATGSQPLEPSRAWVSGPSPVHEGRIGNRQLVTAGRPQRKVESAAPRRGMRSMSSFPQPRVLDQANRAVYMLIHLCMFLIALAALMGR